jgi:hypothetical protein
MFIQQQMKSVEPLSPQTNKQTRVIPEKLLDNRKRKKKIVYSGNESY